MSDSTELEAASCMARMVLQDAEVPPAKDEVIDHTSMPRASHRAIDRHFVFLYSSRALGRVEWAPLAFEFTKKQDKWRRSEIARAANPERAKARKDKR